MRKLFSFVLVAALVITSITPVFAYDYESDELIIEVLPFAGGGVQFFEDWDREFDSPFDRFFFFEFGDGYELIKSHVTEINETFSVGGFEISVLSAVAIFDRPFRRTRFQPRTFLDWDEETGEIIWSEFWEETVYINLVDVYILGTIIDPSRVLADNIEMSMLEISRVRDDSMFLFHSFDTANVLHFDTETDTAYFVARLQVSVDYGAEYVNTDFTIDRALSDFRSTEEYAGIDFANLLATHEASFIVEPLPEYYFPSWRRSGFVMEDLEELLWEDVDPLSPHSETLARGELNIRIMENMYMTNLALRDNLLLIQITEPWDAREPALFGRSYEFTSSQLVDSRFGMADFEYALEGMRESFDEWTLAGYAPEDFDQGALMERFLARRVPEVYLIEISFGGIEPRVSERAFFIEDLDMVRYLDFNITSTGFAVDIPIGFHFPGVYIPILNMDSVSFDGVFQVLIQDNYFGLTDVEITMRGISFRVLDAAPLWVDHLHAFDLFDIDYIFADGTIYSPRFVSGSWGSPGLGNGDTSASYSFGGVFVDIGELVGVRINGTLINVLLQQ